METQPSVDSATTQQRQDTASPRSDWTLAGARAVSEERSMPCPSCGAEMPDLKGGKASICPVCGFKDSCCY